MYPFIENKFVIIDGVVVVAIHAMAVYVVVDVCTPLSSSSVPCMIYSSDCQPQSVYHCNCYHVY